MDAYISKPVDPEKLLGTIASLLSKTASAQPTQEPQDHSRFAAGALAAHDASPPFDVQTVFDRCLKNSKIVGLIFEKFEIQAIDDLKRLAETVASGNGPETARIAHALKGAAGILSAKTLCDLAARLERTARAGDLDNAKACLTELGHEVQRCLSHLPKARGTVVGDGTHAPAGQL